MSKPDPSIANINFARSYLMPQCSKDKANWIPNPIGRVRFPGGMFSLKLATYFGFVVMNEIEAQRQLNIANEKAALSRLVDWLHGSKWRTCRLDFDNDNMICELWSGPPKLQTVRSRGPWHWDIDIYSDFLQPAKWDDDGPIEDSEWNMADVINAALDEIEK